MNRYQTRMPRTALMIGAIAMSVLTLGASVAPAGFSDAAPSAAPAVAAPRTEVTIVPARIEVVTTREPQTVFGAVRQFFNRKVQSS